VTVIELRQYTLVPGRRDELINLFEAEFVESQERCGIRVVGTFRDLGDPQRFVWIRSFPDMERRAGSLADFYGGPVWRRHREAANATMIDSDNVLLLRPVWEPGGFDIAADRRCGEDGPGLVQIGIVPFAGPIPEVTLTYLCDEVAFRVQTSGATLFGCLVSEHATNTFPALPVREGENVLVWCAGFANRAARRRGIATRRELDRITAAWPGVAGSAEVLTLAPTPRSRLVGSSATQFSLVSPRRRSA
jgi:hypothetical protein